VLVLVLMLMLLLILSLPSAVASAGTAPYYLCCSFYDVNACDDADADDTAAS